MMGFLWCAAAALASAMATLLIKLSNQHSIDWNTMRIMFLGAAAGSYALGFVCYSIALQKLDMSLAYPVMTGVAMLLVAGMGVLVLGESLSASKITGMVLIALGAYALAR